MKKLLIVFLLLIFGFAIGYFIRYPIFGNYSKQNSINFEETSDQAGEVVPKSPDLKVAVVVENSPEARPQFGLGMADLVFETLAEGGITRMLAFYGEKDVLRIGPVRSVRPYFVDWALGFGVPLAHSGGSWHALQKIQKLKNVFKDIDEFANQRFFARDLSRSAPHNLFTSSKLLAEASQRNGWIITESQYGWDIVSNLSTAGATTSEIFIDYSYPLFEVSYKYNLVNKSYDRFLAGLPHKDGNSGKQISTNNVVVLHTTSAPLDPKPQFLTIDLKVTGTGQAVLFRDGQIINGRWRKVSPAGTLELLDADGARLGLAHGSIWISVIDQSGTVTWK